MSEQLRMFRMTPGEVELKARQIVDCQNALKDAADRLKAAQEALRGSAEAIAVKEIKDEMKAARETAARLVADLQSEAIQGANGP